MSRRHDWAFYVQLGGLVLLWAFTGVIVVWFASRAYDLYQHGDAWKPALVLGIPVTAVFLCFSVLMTYIFVKLGWTAHPVEPPDKAVDPIEEHLTKGVLAPTSRTYRLVVLGLAAVTAWAFFCWWLQLKQGLHITGLSRPVFWGLYITNFVFFIGISYGGTLVSAVLRLAHSEWRRAITRAAEAIAVLVLAIGGWNIILDLGRPDRMLKMFSWGRMASPLLWDAVAISTYVITCMLYLYLPLIPDLALLRHRVSGWRRPLYHLLAFGWTGTAAQKKALERGISLLAVIVIPIAVSVHSVVAWVFGMTIQPLWHSTIFGPYFVLGAMFSGIAALILVMALLRRCMDLGNFIREVHFRNLGILLLVMSFLWIYFTFSEYLTVFYGDHPEEMAVFMAKFGGRYAPLFWTMVAGCFVIPVAILSRRRTRTITGTVVASVSVCVGMWLERFTIVVPTLTEPRLPFPKASYVPTWIEVSLMLGCFSLFALLYALFARLFPVISLWEMAEGRLDAASETADRIRSYFPQSSVSHKEASP